MNNKAEPKFKIGDTVRVFNEEKGWNYIGKINYISYIEDDSNGNPIYEYGISGFMWLTWEYELSKIDG
jgi:hypothetical protein